MTIGTECPHCESVYQVAADLVGKPMRCPNPGCREVFTVAPSAEMASSPPPALPTPAPPAPVPTPGGSVTDFLPVFEAERVDPPATVPGAVFDAEPVLDAEPVQKAAPLPPVQKAAPLPPVPKAAPLPPAGRAPQVFDWQADPPPASAATRVERRRADADVPVRLRPRRSKWGALVLISMVVLLVGAVGGSVWLFTLSGMRSEEQDAAAADEQYKEGRYVEAQKRFDALAKDYPNSTAADRYRFFSALSGTHAAVTGPGVKDDPTPGRKALDAFLSEYGESPLAQPTDGFGADVVQAGLKLGTAVADHAADRVKKFQGDRTKPELLDAAERAVADGRALLPPLEKFRGKDGPSLDDVRKKLDEAEAGVKKERTRLAALQPFRTLSDDPTDARIDDFERAMKAAGLDKDAEVQRMAAGAKTALRALADRYLPDRVAAGTPPAEVGGVLLAAPRVDRSPVAKDPRKGEAVFGVARGVLYALDARTGEKLWAERVQTEPLSADAPVRVRLQDGAKDWVLVPSLRGGQAALTARDTLSGAAEWHLPLPAPVLGPPVPVGMRLYVPLADTRGTVLELDLPTGDQRGRVELRQPLGGGMAAVDGANSGHAFLVVPGDARRVFVLEVGKLGADGKRQPPRVARVFATDHPQNSLRGPPRVVEAGQADAPRRVILAQTDGPKEMKLRTFALPSAADLGTPSADGDTPPAAQAEVRVSGWTWFPVLCDGERVAVATDAGTFAAFGLNMPGNADKPLFQLPAKPIDPDPAAVSRSQAVSMDEDSFWVVVNNRLSRLRVASDPKGGYRITPQGEPLPVGEPVAAAQELRGESLKYLTLKSADGGSVHLLAFDGETGDVRWRRQLGAFAAAPLVPQPDGSHLLVDAAAGVYRIAADTTEPSVLDRCEPKEAVTSPPGVAADADGSRVWVLAHVPAADAVKLTLRLVVNGKPQEERTFSVPAPPAGKPVAVGDHLVFPLANGFLYRIGAKDGEPAQGPAWRNSKLKADAACYLTATADGQLLWSDGGSQVVRRRWPDKGEVEKTGGPFDLSGPTSGPAVAVTADGKGWVIAADTTGVSVFDPSKPTADPVRRWAGGADTPLPLGRASMLAAWGSKAVWVVEGKAVACGDPGSDKPEWAWPLPADAGEVVGLTPTADGLLVATTDGTVTELNPAGEVAAAATATTSSPMAARAPSRAADRDVLLPSADGTISRLTLRKR